MSGADNQTIIAPQIAWLLEGDPSVRYHTLRDLTSASDDAVSRERSRILEMGWGRQLLDLQDKDGTWSECIYSPKWTSTFYTLLLLKRFGAPDTARIHDACGILLDRGFFEQDGGINYWKTWKQSECCVTGMLLSMLCHFGYDDPRIHRMASFLLAEHMPDNGWNCERFKGATHGSFHTTISVLEGLWEYEKAYPDAAAVRVIRQHQDEGVEFLLQHHLYKSNTTWKTVDPKMTQLSFPPRWHFDILRCLDYFQDRTIPADPRMEDAMELIRSKQTPEGLWKLETDYPGKVFFKLEKVGKESRWNTLRALRVLQWWENSGN